MISNAPWQINCNFSDLKTMTTSRYRNNRDPDYSRYSLDDLRDARDSVDESRFPERVAELEKWIVYRVRNGDIPDRYAEFAETREAGPIRQLAASHLVRGIADIIGALCILLVFNFFIQDRLPEEQLMKAYLIAYLSMLVPLIHGIHELCLFFRKP